MIFLKEIILQIIIWILSLVDNLAEMFTIFTGVKNVTYDGEEVNIIEYVLSSSMVESVLYCMIILSVGLACIFSIYSIIKNFVGERGNLLGIVGKFGLSIMGTIVMASFMILIVLISNRFLNIVSNIFEGVDEVKIGSKMLDGMVLDYLNGYTIRDIDISQIEVRDILGSFEEGVIFPSYYNKNGMIDPDTFMYLPGLIGSICLLIGLLSTIINLARNVFEIAYLYILMPVSLSTLPLDNGERFKGWRESFFSRFLVIFSLLVALNIYLILVPILLRLQVFDSKGLNSIFRIIIISSGTLLLTSSTVLISKLFIVDLSSTNLNSSVGLMYRFSESALRYGVLIPSRGIERSIHEIRENRRRERYMEKREEKEDDRYSEERG